MPKFLYTAKNANGESTGGEIAGKDEKEVAQQLRADGFLITSIKEISDENKDGTKVKFLDRFTSVPLKEKMIFARNLAVMVSSGLTISRSINNLAAQTSNRTFKKILLSIYDDTQAGLSLSEGLAKYPGVFNELFVNMVRVGEVGGNLEEVLGIIALQLEKENELMSKVRGAMIYPAVILFAMILVSILMLTYILPKLMSVFQDMDVKLPASTQFIINVSDALKNHGLLIGIGLIIMLIAIRIFLQTPGGKKTLSFITVHTPILGGIIVKVNCARFARIHSSLLKSGVPVLDSLRIVARTLTNYYYKKALDEGVEIVQKGENLSQVIGSNPAIFPVIVRQMLEVGEETGKTEDVLQRLAEFYEDEVSAITKNLSSILEPVLMLLIGGGVGFFAVAMLQPMYSIMDNIK